eukprot:TRINITY_DN21095_c0_g1_i1.p1 TRINITY_DN21095_c0_g1~~TRINITY_DN21095_c0_g1_i1.p1  ORF type:complete len:344 (-),score=85.45 TRINITY_DN21095_c0_g1_i1:73-1104(-)
MGTSVSCQPVSCQPAIQKCQASVPCALLRDPNEASITGIHCPSPDVVDLPNAADALVQLHASCKCHGPNGFCSQPVQVEATLNSGRSNFLQKVEEVSDSEIDRVAAEVDAQVRVLEAEDWLPESDPLKDAMTLAASVAAEINEDVTKSAVSAAVETGDVPSNEDSLDVASDFHEAKAMGPLPCEPPIDQEKEQEIFEYPAMEKGTAAQDGSTSPLAGPEAIEAAGRRQPEEEPGAEPPPAAAENRFEPELAEAQIPATWLGNASIEVRQQDDSSQSPPMKLFHISSTMELCAESEDTEDAAVDQPSTPLPVAPPPAEPPAKPKSGRPKSRKVNHQRANELLLW